MPDEPIPVRETAARLEGLEGVLDVTTHPAGRDHGGRAEFEIVCVAGEGEKVAAVLRDSFDGLRIVEQSAGAVQDDLVVQAGEAAA